MRRSLGLDGAFLSVGWFLVWSAAYRRPRSSGYRCSPLEWIVGTGPHVGGLHVGAAVPQLLLIAPWIGVGGDGDPVKGDRGPLDLADLGADVDQLATAFKTT